jgi:TgpA N-terminal domain/Transglutaminase-like superfamily
VSILSALKERLARSDLPAAAWVPDVAIPAGLAAATFLAATPWLAGYRIAGAVVFLAVASVASVLATVLTARVWRQPAPVSYLVSAAGLLLLLLIGVGPHPGGVWAGLVHGPSRLLSETLPLGGSRAQLAAPVVLTWMCGALTTELVIRARPDRRSAGDIGLLVPVVVYVLAYAVTSSAPGRDHVGGVLLLLTLIAIGLARHLHDQSASVSATSRSSSSALPDDPDGRPSPWRPAAAGAIVGVVVAVVLAVTVPSLPSMSRKPASLNRPAQLASGLIVDPVDTMGALRDTESRTASHPIMTVSTNAPSTGYLGMAVLDQYDGALWSFDATFQPTGGRVPEPSLEAPLPSAASTVVQHVSLSASLPIPMLPAIDRPTSVSGLRVAADAATGMIVPDQELGGSGDFTVVSRGAAVTLAHVPPGDGIGIASGAALPANGAGTQSDLALPPGATSAMTTALRFLARITGSRPAPTVAFLQDVVNSLHADEKRINPALPATNSSTTLAPNSGEKGKASRPGGSVTTTTVAPEGLLGGTSLSEVINNVTVNQSATPEQFATLVAMVARDLGVPARVVTGFRIAPSSDGVAVAPGSHTVTDRQAWTWVEIPVSGLGWVVVDPTPDAETGLSGPPPQQVQATPTTVKPPQANAVPRNEIAGGHAVAKPATVKIPKSHSLPVWLVALLIAVGIIVVVAALGPGLAAARRAARRQARHREEPAELAVGAWLELLDGLTQAGMVTAPGATSSEVAAEAGRHFGPDLVDPVYEIGTLADRAVCSLRDPPDGPSAQAAWEAQRGLRRTIHGRLERPQRARALMAVGSGPRRPRAASDQDGRE